MKTTISVVTAIALVTGTMLSAPPAMATLKTRTKSNQANERAVENPSSPSLDTAKHCAMGTHIKDAVLARGAGSPPSACDASVVEAEMTVCTTGASDWSWGTSQSGAGPYKGSAITNSAEQVTTTTADASLDRPVGQPNAAGLGSHISLCDALQKATVAINADPEKLASVQAKVSVQDLHFVYDMLVSNGVPADLLPEPGDASAKAGCKSCGWDLATGKGGRTIASGQPSPLQINVSWTPDKSGKIYKTGHVSLIK